MKVLKKPPLQISIFFVTEGRGMINVEAEVSKHKNCKDRDELVGLIKEYKNLAIKNAHDIFAAGQYNMVAHKLQEICDKLPGPNLKISTGGSPQNTPVKSAKITKEEKVRISDAWNKRTGNK